MKENRESQLTQVYLKEYEILKTEAISRAGIRDNLLYVVLIAYSGVISVVISGNPPQALLLLPIIGFALGWTFIINDEKISSMGKYIHFVLTEKIKEALHCDDSSIFAWETFHRSDKKRRGRKIVMLLVNVLLFVVSGLVAILTLWIIAPTTFVGFWWMICLEVFLLLILGVQFIIYADV